MTLPARLCPLDEFLTFDDGTDTRYELFDGHIVAIAPALDVHGALVARLVVRLGAGRDRGRHRPARARRQLLSGRPRGHLHGADRTAVRHRAGPGRRGALAFDRDHRSRAPRRPHDPSLQDLLVVSSTEGRIEHFHREQGGWKIVDLRNRGTLRLEALDLTLDLAELTPAC